MKDLNSSSNPFNESIDIRSYVIEPIEKYIERRGFMYILLDTVYPGVFKIGMTTNMQKRFLTYNSDRPYKTARFAKVSLPFVDCKKVERIIIDQLYKVTEPTTFSKEWFNIDHISLAEELINLAESKVEIYIK